MLKKIGWAQSTDYRLSLHIAFGIYIYNKSGHLVSRIYNPFKARTRFHQIALISICDVNCFGPANSGHTHPLNSQSIWYFVFSGAKIIHRKSGTLEILFTQLRCSPSISQVGLLWLWIIFVGHYRLSSCSNARYLPQYRSSTYREFFRPCQCTLVQ